jgi:protein tyrosine phosphatase (PTP) superfamily phosphohydrolase (DUF442 family)
MKRALLKGTAFGLLLIVPAAYGLYNIFQPVHYPIKFFRGQVVKAAETLIFGPYPTEKEIKQLKALGVKHVINLMDSSLPFESPLIEKEQLLLQKNGMTFRNVPLAYLPNLESRENLDKVHALVADLLKHSELTYVHCYLGRHRTNLVKHHYLEALEHRDEAAEPRHEDDGENDEEEAAHRDEDDN